MNGQAVRLPYKRVGCYSPRMAHPPRIPVCLPPDQDAVYFITFCVQDRSHVLAAPMRDREASVGDFVVAIKRWMRKKISAEWHWQKGFFDRLLRHDESAQAKWEYVRENPVRKKLVEDWRDWPYSIRFLELPHL